MRDAQRKRREESFILCPCLLCLNRVQLKGSDVNKHIAQFGLANKTLPCEDDEENEMKAVSTRIDVLSTEQMDIPIQGDCCNDHSLPSCSWQTMEPPSKEPKISVEATSLVNSVLPQKASPSRKSSSTDDTNSSLINGSTTSRSTASSEFIDEMEAYQKTSASNYSVSSATESESTDAENDRVVPDYLRQLNDEEELYSSDKANLRLFEGSTVNVLQALCGYFSWFTEHPGTSKNALSDLLRLHRDEILPQGNNLPSSYDEAISFIKPFLLPFVTYHACPNDCVLFRKTDRYDYSSLKQCPVCNRARFISKGKPYRKFTTIH